MTAPILRRAAQAFRDGELTWGKEFFVQAHDDLCRCALGAIAYAIYPDDTRDADGNPAFMPLGVEAMTVLAEYLVDELDAADCRYDELTRDLIETVGTWNDEQDDVATVIAALEAAADRAAS